MNAHTTLQEHHQLCDELHQLALDENRFLRQHQRAPDASVIERKRTLLARLDTVLDSLRTIPAASARDTVTHQQLEKTRARILQILQLDKENEQLLLRCSLATGRTKVGAQPSASASMLQRIYSRCS